MIKGVGSDLVNSERIYNLHTKYEMLPKKILGQRELQIYQSLVAQKQVNYLAKRFAAKEAISKALGTGIGKPYRFTDIEIINNGDGKPEVFIRGEYREAIMVTLSDEGELVLAFAVISE